MVPPISRRHFAGTGLGCLAATISRDIAAARLDHYPPIVDNYDFDAYTHRYADSGGVYDTKSGLVWGYEPNASFPDYGYGVSWKTDSQADQWYLNALLSQAAAYRSRGTTLDLTNAQTYEAAYTVASRYIWRLPTVG